MRLRFASVDCPAARAPKWLAFAFLSIQTVSGRLRWLPVLVALASIPRAAAASDDLASEPEDLFLRVQGDLGLAYTTNVYGNASEIADGFGVGRLAVDLDFLANDAWIIKATYRASGELYRQESTERHFAQVLELSNGVRAASWLYFSLDAGAEHAFFPNRTAYSFWGVFGGLATRWELGESHTVRLAYVARSDTFPNYDLDNLSQRGKLSWLAALGDSFELLLPLRVELTSYRERYLLDETGQLSADNRVNQNGVLAPQLTYLPDLDWRLDVGGFGELNSSNDTYYYTGPVVSGAPAMDPQLVRHFDSYSAWGGSVAFDWEMAAGLRLFARVRGGQRHYPERVAYDASGLPTGETQQDAWLAPQGDITWDAFSLLRLTLAYSYFRQWSNDALWAFDAHTAHLLLGVGWEG